MPPVFRLRAATADDVPLILSLIRELAEFERLSHEVVTDEAGLRAQLFGPHPRAEVLLAENTAADHDAPAGFALFFHNFSTFVGKPGIYLEDLYVRPAFRGRGLGRALLTRLAQIAVERDCGRFEWAVLDWNEPALKFYESLGAKGMHDWTVHRLVGDELATLAERWPHPVGKT